MTTFLSSSVCSCCGSFAHEKFCSEACRHAYEENVEEYLAAAHLARREPFIRPVESRPDVAGLNRCIRDWLLAFGPRVRVGLPADPQDEKLHKSDFERYPHAQD